MNRIWKSGSKSRKKSVVRMVRTVEDTPVEKDPQEISKDLEGKESSSVMLSTPCLPRTSSPCKSVLTLSLCKLCVDCPCSCPKDRTSDPYDRIGVSIVHYVSHMSRYINSQNR
jgi:hypothetical protein